MADRKYYCLCDSGCKFETMSKEQILTAITQAVNNGEIGNIDTGFVTTLKTINGTPLKFFVGSQYEYETLTDDDKQNLFAVITNDTTKEAIEKTLEKLRKDLDDLQDGLQDGSINVERAKTVGTEIYNTPIDICNEIKTLTVSQSVENKYFVVEFEVGNNPIGIRTNPICISKIGDMYYQDFNVFNDGWFGKFTIALGANANTEVYVQVGDDKWKNAIGTEGDYISIRVKKIYTV